MLCLRKSTLACRHRVFTTLQCDNMISKKDILERGADPNDKSVANPWRWQWLGDTFMNEHLYDKSGKGIPKDKRKPPSPCGVYEDHKIKKISQSGKAWCELCKKVILYGSSGKKDLSRHCNGFTHLANYEAAKANYRLSGKSFIICLVYCQCN